jgi:hypothetical protein
MPELRRREQASNAELQAIADRSVTRAAYLRIMRLLVKEVLVGDDKIIIRHCIPLRSGDGPPDGA